MAKNWYYQHEYSRHVNSENTRSSISYKYDIRITVETMCSVNTLFTKPTTKQDAQTIAIYHSAHCNYQPYLMRLWAVGYGGGNTGDDIELPIKYCFNISELRQNTVYDY